RTTAPTVDDYDAIPTPGRHGWTVVQREFRRVGWSASIPMELLSGFCSSWSQAGLNRCVDGHAEPERQDGRHGSSRGYNRRHDEQSVRRSYQFATGAAGTYADSNANSNANANA